MCVWVVCVCVWVTWGTSDDVHSLLQGPAALLGVGAANQQFTPQLWLGEELLEAQHEVVSLFCQVFRGLQDDGCGLAVGRACCRKVLPCGQSHDAQDRLPRMTDKTCSACH